MDTLTKAWSKVKREKTADIRTDSDVARKLTWSWDRHISNKQNTETSKTGGETNKEFDWQKILTQAIWTVVKMTD